ncbi:MAG: signal peptidase II [Thermoleophilia bacterium]|nr:signal peptidase II [Thermoleophilia bacterium]
MSRRQAEPRVRDVRVGSATDGLAAVSHVPALSARRPHWLALGAVAGAAVAADQVTKHVVTSTLDLGEDAQVLGPVTIHHVQNTGIAFGLLGGATLFVAAFTALALAWMAVFFARSGGRHGLLPVALGFLIGGSTSNLVDRLRLGHVTDFLDVGFWPAFNLADTFIVTGVGLFVLALFAADRAARPAPVVRRREPARTTPPPRDVAQMPPERRRVSG